MWVMKMRRLPSVLILLALVSLAQREAHSANNQVGTASAGHRQHSARDVHSQGSSASEATKRLDEELDRKLKSICRGC